MELRSWPPARLSPRPDSQAAAAALAKLSSANRAGFCLPRPHSTEFGTRRHRPPSAECLTAKMAQSDLPMRIPAMLLVSRIHAWHVLLLRPGNLGKADFKLLYRMWSAYQDAEKLHVGITRAVRQCCQVLLHAIAATKTTSKPQ